MWAFVAAGLAIAPPALAQERIVVLPFSGPSGAAAQAAARRALAERFEVVGVDEWQAEAGRLNARGTAPRNLAKVAASLGLKAVITGGLSRLRRGWTLAIVVHDGADGSVLDRGSRQIPAPNRAGAVGGSLARSLIPAIQAADGASGGGSRSARPAPEPEPVESYAEPPPDEPPPPTYAGSGSQILDDEDPTGRRRPRATVEEEEVDQVEDVEGEDDEERPRPTKRRRSPAGWMELGLEVDGAYRSFSVPIHASCDTDNRTEAAFHSSVYPEIGVRLSFYPGGLFTSRGAAHIGIEGDFHHHLYLKVLNRRRNQEVESSEYAFSVGLTYRIVRGTADRGITVWPRAGFGRYDFFLGDVGNDIVPPFTYDHIYMGLNMYVPLATRYAGLELGGHYLAVLNIGAAAIEAYNASGELPTTHGFEFNAGFSGQIYAGLRWRIAFDMMGFSSSHVGKGHGWGRNVDGNPSTLCTSDACIRNPTTCVDMSSPERTRIEGGIMTTDYGFDLIWRLIFGLSYRFGWDPGDRRGDRGGAPGRGGSWYDDGSSRDGGGEGREASEEREPEDNWDDGGW